MMENTNNGIIVNPVNIISNGSVSIKLETDEGLPWTEYGKFALMLYITANSGEYTDVRVYIYTNGNELTFEEISEDNSVLLLFNITDVTTPIPFNKFQFAPEDWF